MVTVSRYNRTAERSDQGPVLLQTKRLQVASELELAETLIGDLQAFDFKPIERNPDLRGGRNADLVFALATALWWADRLTWNDDDVGKARPGRSLGEHAWMGM